MEIAVLTSSRADYGFYKPLLKSLIKENEIKFKLIVFGTHLSIDHGYTVSDIKASGSFDIIEINTFLKGYKPYNIAKNIANTHSKFAEFWKKNIFELIICIGDRYEMFSAVSASVPFNMPIAHISGGEETLGSIDNIYRHSLSVIAKYHFTNTKLNAERVSQIKGSSKNIYHTGSLAIDNINQTELYSNIEFKHLFNFNLDEPFILFTFHPETVNYEMNFKYIIIMSEILISSEYNVLISMPNADTMNGIIRDVLSEIAVKNNHIFSFESLGSKGYYSALSSCSFVLGNSSSGIIEAASFSKYVINIGSRQLGREHGNNIIHCKIDKNEIQQEIKNISKLKKLNSENIYGDGLTSERIVDILKKNIIRKN